MSLSRTCGAARSSGYSIWPRLAGEFKQKPVPHRFRHTFCRILLERGVSVADVAELIGDTEDIVYKHYAKWVPERQRRLTEVLKAAFDDRPRLVAINGKTARLA